MAERTAAIGAWLGAWLRGWVRGWRRCLNGVAGVSERLAVTELASRQRAALRRLETNPPAYLTTAIGRPTLLLRRDDQAALDSWRDLTLRVESYRLQYAVTDPTRTLGPRPAGLAQRADRSRIATDIAWSPFGSLPDRHDLGWLNVIGQPDRDPAGALGILAAATRRHASLLGDAGAALEARPSAVLRRRLEEAIGLLRQRPQDQSGQRIRRAWDTEHQLALAEGHIAARELRRRELQALQQLAKDPPAFLTRELGPPRASSQPAPHGLPVPARSSPTAPPTPSTAPMPSATAPSTTWHASTATSPSATSTTPNSSSNAPDSTTPRRDPPSRTMVDLADSFDPPM